ncbi:coiled-coil and C2 domain-containing protein 1-like isoform X2 [Episyrphus balteatus]|uniref:coiled-coil and C2 domain-containing protein 1-like isoform X2 n=1 Tax=Episyrphus balteatus TaxID=286459 RepID=UPI002486BF85|nr:coiled-coil and C2 domain-containing protein 1-like isoform X2 [Episyrphus balteatus]
MFGRKKPEPPKRRNHDLSQFGLTEIPDDFDPSGGAHDDGGDSDFEAELAAIVGGGGKQKPKAKPKPTLIPASDLDKMISESMRDIGSDEEMSDDDDDPELLGELQGIAGGALEADEPSPSEEREAQAQQTFLPTTTTDTISIIKTRIEMYKLAEAAAKSAGESAKARRFNRGLKTLNDLLKQSVAGNSINVDDIPPEVSVKSAKPPEEPSAEAQEPPKVPARQAPTVPSRPAPGPPPPVEKTPSVEEKPLVVLEEPKPENPVLMKLNDRKQEYKIAALTAKRSGDTALALQFVKVLKQFDMVIKLCEEGKEVDLSDMPPPPNEFAEFLSKMQAGAAEEPTKVEEPTPAPVPAPPTPEEPLTTATTILEALEQRLQKYKSVEEGAKAENNSSKARRFGRIVKQYEDAIKSYKAGRQVAFDELPTPPGFGPLPGSGDAPPAAPSTPAATSPVLPPKPAPVVTPEGDGDSLEETPKPSQKPSPKKELTTRMSGNQHSTNLAEQQMKILLERQKEFKVAAIEAKKAGEIDQAKEYLKIYKGFEGLLNAASSGLPVDLNTLPLPPSQRENLEASFAIVNPGDCDPNDDISDISVRLEEQLAKQLMMCKNTRDHHKAMGDIAGMNRFENLAVTVQKDLDLLRYSKRKNLSLPKFHYEQKSFNIVHCNTDLTDNEVEIMVVRGINYNVPNPKDVDTYVKIEFPYPQDDFFKAKSSLVRDTDSPEYNQRFSVDILRSNRQCQRIFKRQAVKFEVYSRGGFLRSDTLIGTVNAKLQPLETKCETHDTYDLMEGRKTVGGKLEIKIRVRNPILTKQIEHVNEKWLILDT